MLLNFVRWPISYKRQWLYRITHKVRDVVKLRSKAENPYFIISQQTINLPTNTYVANVKMPNINHPLKFYDRQFNCYYHSTPVSRILNESFFVEVDQDIYFVLNQDPLIKNPESPLFEMTGASAYLQPVVAETIKGINKPISKELLLNTIIKDVMVQSLDLKLQKKMFKELLKIVESKIQVLDEQIRQAEVKLAQKANKRVKWFTTFIMAEIAIIHYFIYFNLSWDIMEPITVILANIDLMIGYWFFILKGRPFSCENWHSELFKNFRHRHLRNSGIDLNKYEEYLQIRDDLVNRLKFLTKNPNVFLENCSKPLKILNNQ